jgi:hypothetical protein
MTWDILLYTIFVRMTLGFCARFGRKKTKISQKQVANIREFVIKLGNF